MRAVALATAVTVVGLLGQTGCASLFAAGPDLISVNTNPPGAFVYINGQYLGQTPTIVELDRGRGGEIQVYLPGFQPYITVREKAVNGWFWANILWFYVVVPVVVDVVTGNWQRFDDQPINIGLTPAAGPPPPWSPPPGAPAPAPPPPPR